MPWIFAITLFVSATLLFLVQPMVAKMILPKFGGTPGVWSTSMVFFQGALLAGYAYAHALPNWLGTRRQALVHVGVLFLPFLLLPAAVLVWPYLVLPFGVTADWAPPGDSHPAIWVLILLVLTVGVPFFIVSTSAPLLQKWFASTGHPSGRDPYFLYAASNLGSMVALLSYPFFIEPYLGLAEQSWAWTVGYAVLILAAGGCAGLVWLHAGAAAPAAEGSTEASAAGTSPPETAVQSEAQRDLPPPADLPPPPADDADAAAITADKPKGKKKKKKGQAAKEASTEITAQKPEPLPPEAARDEVPNFRRRFRWVLLGFVPSSLMLSVTTYLTTDISAIPLFWIIPLTLYLLSFILVFSQLFRTFQLAINGLLILLAPLVAGYFLGFWHVLIWTSLVAGGVATLVLGLMVAIKKLKDPNDRFWGSNTEEVGHKMLVVLMPIAVLLLVALMLMGRAPNDFRLTFAIHLAVLFVVAMVCHGELYWTRPSTQYLTEFYLWMALGGVLGGIFNALLAPVVFGDVYEYRITLVIACMVLPPIIGEKKGTMTDVLDVGVPAIISVMGLMVIVLRLLDGNLDFQPILEYYPFGYAAWIGLILFSVALAAWYILRSKEDRLARGLDVAVALALGVLTAAILYRPPSTILPVKILDLLRKFLRLFSSAEGQELDALLDLLISYGLLLLFCYIFVEQPIRFGLCLGSVLLVATTVGDLRDTVVHRERSFFCVLSVKKQEVSDTERYHTLVHGTTLHGQQRYVTNAELIAAYLTPLAASTPGEALTFEAIGKGRQLWVERNEALTYFHKTGPIGQLFEELHKRGPDRPMGVLGMGTGTLAAYSLPSAEAFALRQAPLRGQELDFFEIDPQMVNIALDPKLFTYLRDAEARGVKLNIVLGDGRLQIARQPDGKYGMIAMDAFSSDSVPIHLITREALAMYRDKLLPGGIILINISNRYLDLAPVLGNLAHETGMVAISRMDGGDPSLNKLSSRWVLLARKMSDFGSLAGDPRWEKLDYNPKHSVWTDDFSNLLETMKRDE